MVPDQEVSLVVLPSQVGRTNGPGSSNQRIVDPSVVGCVDKVLVDLSRGLVEKSFLNLHPKDLDEEVDVVVDVVDVGVGKITMMTDMIKDLHSLTAL